MDIKNIKYTASIDKESFEVLNSEFTKAKAYILYYGENRNKSKMSKEAVESAMTSLYNIPIVAEWIEKKEDFGTHGGKIILSDEGIEYVQTTKPYGVVPESCNPRWEMVEDKEYLVADIILWSGRYSELGKTIEEFSNQSMEINVVEGNWSEESDVYDIQKFEFSALCLLGQEVEPCFENSKVISYSLDEFKEEMNEMIKKYKEFMSADTKPEPELELELEPETHEELSFSVTYRQKREALQNALDPIVVKDEEDKTVEETYYWIEDFDDQYVYVEKSYWTPDNYEREYGRFTYTFDETNLTATIGNDFEKMLLVWLTEAENQEIQDQRTQVMTLEKERHDLLKEIEDYKLTIEQNNNIISELQNFKNKVEVEIKQSQVDEIISDFESILKDCDGFIKIKEKAMDMEIEDLEKELYALEGKIKHSKSTKSTKKVTTFSRVSVDIDENETEPKTNYYGNAQKYLDN